MRISLLILILLTTSTQSVLAKDCWWLTDLKGQLATSSNQYSFQSDKFSQPMLLCFEKESGSVSGDDTRLVRLGMSTLVGFVENNGLELVESYQIDRVKGKVLFIKSRIGTSSILPNGPDVIGSFVGKATKLP